MNSIPVWVRKFLMDAIEGSIASALALSVAIPASVEEGKALAAAVAIGSIHAVVSAARRNAPALYAWLREVFGVTE